VARPIQQSRNLTGFSALTTTTQALTITPAGLPDGATVTRVVGQTVLEYMPAAGSADRALIVVGLGVVNAATVLDVALPNANPDIWLWWWYQPLLLNFGGSSGLVQQARDLSIPFDVHGQRILTPSSGVHLRFFSRLVSPISAGVASIRIGTVQFYKLPV
jgi:hypothetical protein